MKKEISNICPIRGVTINQLLSQAEYLVGTMKEAFSLTKEANQEAIDFAVTYVWNKMLAGKVDKFNYNNFKGYLFISLKNEVFSQLNKKNIQREKVIINSDDIEEYKDQFSESNSIEENSDYKDLFNKLWLELNPQEREILQDIMDGVYFTDVAKKHNLTVKELTNFRNIFKNKLGELIPELKTPQLKTLQLKPKKEKPIKEKPVKNKQRKERKVTESLGNKIKPLHQQGYSRTEIMVLLKCSSSIITYHTNPTSKAGYKRRWAEKHRLNKTLINNDLN